MGKFLVKNENVKWNFKQKFRDKPDSVVLMFDI